MRWLFNNQKESTKYTLDFSGIACTMAIYEQRTKITKEERKPIMFLLGNLLR